MRARDFCGTSHDTGMSVGGCLKPSLEQTGALALATSYSAILLKGSCIKNDFSSMYFTLGLVGEAPEVFEADNGHASPIGVM